MLLPYLKGFFYLLVFILCDCLWDIWLLKDFNYLQVKHITSDMKALSKEKWELFFLSPVENSKEILGGDFQSNLRKFGCNLHEIIIYLSFPCKNNQFQKKNPLNRSPDIGDIGDLNIALFSRFQWWPRRLQRW